MCSKTFVFASTCDYVSIVCLLTGEIGIAMEYMFFIGKCMQTLRNDCSSSKTKVEEGVCVLKEV